MIFYWELANGSFLLPALPKLQITVERTARETSPPLLAGRLRCNNGGFTLTAFRNRCGEGILPPTPRASQYCL